MIKSSSVSAKITEGIILFLITLLSVVYKNAIVPLVLLCSVLFVIVTVRRDRIFISYCAFLVFMGTLLGTFINGDIYNIKLVLEEILTAFSIVLPAFIIGLTLKMGKELFFVVASGTLSNVFVVILKFLKLKYIDLIVIEDAFVVRPVKNLFNKFLLVLQQTGEATDELTQSINQMSLTYIKLFQMMMPSILIVVSMIVAFLVFLVARKILYKGYGINFPNVLFFWEIRLERKVSVSVVILVLLTLFLPDGIVSHALANILLVMLSMYMIAGLSVLDFYFRKTGVFSTVRGFVYFFGMFVLLLFASLFSTLTSIPIINPLYILMIVGLFDSTLNFRKFSKNNNLKG